MKAEGGHSHQLALRPCALIGMVHVRALPGAPRHSLPIAEIEAIAVREARTLADAGFDALIVENMHDAPYLRRSDTPEVIAAMTRVVGAVVAAVPVPVGVQILSHANSAALAVAHVAGARFIRCEGFVFSSVSDEGLVRDACAGQLLRDRVRLGATAVAIWADIKKKHSSHAITADLTMRDWAHAAEFFGADAVVVTGRETGDPVDGESLDETAAASRLPVYVGSGATPDSLTAILARASGVIVGSALKREGLWSNELDACRVKAMAAARDSCRSAHGA